MKARLLPAITLLLLLHATGCITPTQRRAHQVQQRAESDHVQSSIAALKERIAALEISQQEVIARMNNTRTAVRAENDAMRKRLNEIKVELRQIDAARASDRQKLYDKLASKMAAIVNSPSISTGGVSEFGREHKIKAGETLSQIAKAYGTSLKAIMAANRLKNANTIREGQVLFIPE